MGLVQTHFTKSSKPTRLKPITLQLIEFECFKKKSVRTLPSISYLLSYLVVLADVADDLWIAVKNRDRGGGLGGAARVKVRRENPKAVDVGGHGQRPASNGVLASKHCRDNCSTTIAESFEHGSNGPCCYWIRFKLSKMYERFNFLYRVLNA